MPTQTQYDDAYETCAETYATLRIMAVELDPDEVTCLLKITPTKIQRRGEIRPSKASVPVVNKLSGWFLSTKGLISSRDSRRHIDWILERIRHSKEAFRSFQSLGHLVDISCYWVSSGGHGGPSLTPSQMRDLAELEIKVWFDIYFDDPAEKSDKHP